MDAALGMRAETVCECVRELVGVRQKNGWQVAGPPVFAWTAYGMAWETGSMGWYPAFTANFPMLYRSGATFTAQEVPMQIGVAKPDIAADSRIYIRGGDKHLCGQITDVTKSDNPIRMLSGDPAVGRHVAKLVADSWGVKPDWRTFYDISTQRAPESKSNRWGPQKRYLDTTNLKGGAWERPGDENPATGLLQELVDGPVRGVTLKGTIAGLLAEYAAVERCSR